MQGECIVKASELHWSTVLNPAIMLIFQELFYRFNFILLDMPCFGLVLLMLIQTKCLFWHSSLYLLSINFMERK